LSGVDRPVLSRSEDFKVLGPVVRAVAVDVVDMLVRPKFAAEFVPHHNAVPEVPPAVPRLHIPALPVEEPRIAVAHGGLVVAADVARGLPLHIPAPLAGSLVERGGEPAAALAVGGHSAVSLVCQASAFWKSRSNFQGFSATYDAGSSIRPCSSR